MTCDRSNLNSDAAIFPREGRCATPAVKAAASFDRWLQRLDCPAKILIEPIKVHQTDVRQKRKQEFHAGRGLTSKLLAGFGEYRSVGVNEDRSPKWPRGYVGSISHSGRWVWVAVARIDEVRSIGIDTEPVVDAATYRQLTSEIATNAEWDIASSLSLGAQQTFSVVFSAKEAFFKCWYPQTQNYFGFEHAVVDDVAVDRIRIRNVKSNPNFGVEPQSLDVFYLCSGNDVFTATWMKQEKP